MQELNSTNLENNEDPFISGYDLIVLFVQCLKSYNIDIIYGLIGIPVTQLSRSAQKYGIRFISMHNEQAASMAAGAYGFLEKKPGICLTVAAPGFINALSGLANATVNCFPMILISGSSNLDMIDLNQLDYQGLDQLNTARPFAKAAYRIDSIENIPTGVARAMRTAISGRPGGVYLDIPASVLHAVIPKQVSIKARKTIDLLNEVVATVDDRPDAAFNLLKSAHCPLIIIGKGAAYSRTENQLLEFVTKYHIPFLNMSMAKGLLSDKHELCVDAARSLSLGNADLVMLIGARLNWLLANGAHPPFAENDKLIQIDINGEEIDAYRKVDVALIGNIQTVISQLNKKNEPLDFTRVLSGPTCAMMLADQGARVIKIGRPITGDDTRQMGPFYDDGLSVYSAFPNRGKESITLDLKNSDDLALAKRMIAKADVVVENFCPGTFAKLGLDPNKLTQDNPRLIVCSISEFGQYGPLHQDAAYDTVIQALSGIMDATGFPDGPATRVGTSIADLQAGIFGFCGILAALYAREKTGKGTTVDVAMLDSVFAIPVGNDKLFTALCKALDLGDCIKDERLTTNVNRYQNHTPLKAIMEEVLSAKKAEDWCEILEIAGVPCDLILNIDDTRNLEQIKSRGMVQEVAGRLIPGNPIKFGSYYSLASVIPPPELNADSEKLRKEFS